MSLYDKLFPDKSTTRRLIDAKGLTDSGVQTYDHGGIVYFIVAPVNLAVLSRGATQAKVTDLMNLLKETPALELVCLNSRENFEGNKLALRERLAAEGNPAVRRLLEKDMAFLDRIQIQTASAREFLVALRFQKDEDRPPAVSRMERLLREHGFFTRAAGKDDLKRIVAVYFAQNMTQIIFDDYDGEHWAAGGAG